jgi:oxygen-dependent protoporphyrinogen oxidase
MKNEVAIVGAGFSGLTLAWYLSQRGCDVVIYEKEKRFGGLISSQRHSKMLIESAANAVMWTKSAEALFRDLEITPVFPQSSARNRYLWRGEKKRWPLTLSESLKLFLKLGPKLLFRKDSLKPKAQQTLEQWGEEHIGQAAVDFLLAPAFQGVYAGSANKLSASLLLARIFDPHRKKDPQYRGLATAPNGMGQLISVLVEKLKARGVRFEMQAAPPIVDGRKYVIATSASQASSILREVRPVLSQLLSKIEMLPLLSVAVCAPTATAKINGFGMLMPRGQSARTLGILSNTSIFADRGATLNETWILGGATDPEVMQLSDHEVKELIQKEREVLLGDISPVEIVQIHRWPQALPHYSVELEKLLPEIRTHLQSDPEIFLTGNYLGSIGLSQILEMNSQLAEKVSHVE